jgi:cytochrome c-type biogenesis protein CcmE
MTRKRRRLYGVLLGLTALGAATAMALLAFQDNLVFFFSPSDLIAKPPAADRSLRLGGLVETESVKKLPDGRTVEFRITDGPNAIAVHYAGILPDLFREGQGVVVEGKLIAGVFQAREVLAKHDETYMPREVADALKKAGHWQEGKKP